MARWTDSTLATTLAGDDVVLMADVSEAVGTRDRRVTLAALRTFLGAGITVGVTQAAHGLSVGDVVRFDGTAYVKATADTAGNAEAVGVVTAVPDSGTFAYQTAGVVATLSALTPGELYYLQDDGSLGTSAGTVDKPILIATSATSAVLILAIGGESGGGGGGGGSSVQSFVVACSDEITDLTTGASKVTFRMPYAFTVTGVRASLTTAATGSAVQVDINEGGTTILSTKLTIDDGEKSSESAATQAVISDGSLADDAEITIDIDAVGSTTPGKGLKVSIIGSPT